MYSMYYIRPGFILITALLSAKLQAQGIYIGSQASLVMNDKVHMVLNNAGFTKNGNFAAGKSTIWFTGNDTVHASVIDGNTSFNFYNAIVNKRKSGVRLHQSIGCNDTIYMRTGNLLLDTYTFTLGISAGIAGENPDSYITSDSTGYIVTLKSMPASPVAFNPGNLGMEITGTAGSGVIFAFRRPVQITLPNGSKSIKRVYDFALTNNAPVNVTLRFHYFDQELAGNNESQLGLWNKDSTNAWVSSGRDSIDIVNNVVIKSGITKLADFTLSDGANGLRTITTVKSQQANIIAESNANNDKMQVYPVPAHDYCIQIVYSDRNRKSECYLFDEWGRLLQRKKIYLLPGANNISWNLGGYPAGVYYFGSDNLKINKIKIIKQ